MRLVLHFHVLFLKLPVRSMIFYPLFKFRQGNEGLIPDRKTIDALPLEDGGEEFIPDVSDPSLATSP